jgi:ankyrin repeat protein
LELFAQDADLNVADEKGRTSLTHLAFNGYADFIIILLKLGADVNHKDGRGFTARDCAVFCKKRQWKKVVWLLDQDVGDRAPGKLVYP